MSTKQIAVVGMGYVGLSLAVLLAQRHRVVAIDVAPSKVAMINDRRSPIEDQDVERFLAHEPLTLTASLDAPQHYATADIVFVATPTDYDDEANQFNTSTVECVIDQVLTTNPRAVVVVKSTVPVGFTARMRAVYPGTSIVFSPEFLREGRALHDNLYPSRIVVGDRGDTGRAVADLLIEGAISRDVPVLLTGSTEAEAIKLFANAYLAVRVAYFNELDTYAATHDLDTAQIIAGIGTDPRIGTHYNNPSFGFGGYCLPKDTKQLLAAYQDVPQNMISAVVKANDTRKRFVVDDIMRREPRTVGVHRLTMKTGSDNFRTSAIQCVMRMLRGRGVEVLVHEPTIEADCFDQFEVVKDVEELKSRADLIVANRACGSLADVAHKVYTRDIYGRD